jgi:hypothetical protein
MILDVSRLSWEKPLLCLDVDGVLNVINRSQNRKTYDIFRSDSGFWIRFRRELPGWLDRLVDHFDLVWCTMWDHNANTELADRLDLPWLPYIPCWDGQDTVAEWDGMLVHTKVPCIDKYVQDMPFAWVDDSFVKGDFTWADWRDNNLAPTKLFQIDPRMGLLEHHVNKLVAWAELIK